jgi:hypothetical protein
MNDTNLPQTASKSSFKFIFTWMGVGILASVTLVSIYLPRTILWYFDPPTSNGISCTPSIRWSLDRLLNGQLISLAIGAIIGLAIGFKFRKKA